jgi:hypothetical protein
MDYNSSKNQSIKRKLVDREVFYCVSTLVSELSKNWEQFPDYTDDLLDAYRGLPDYDEALADNGCEPFVDKHGVDCWCDTRDGMTWAGTAEEACNAFEIDADDYCPEIFEHWIVSNYLAEKLEEHGHKVLRDFFGMTVWCRPTTGQAIMLDEVISEICAEMEILEGQRNEWTV